MDVADTVSTESIIPGIHFVSAALGIVLQLYIEIQVVISLGVTLDMVDIAAKRDLEAKDFL